MDGPQGKGCKYIIDQYSTSRTAHRCGRPTVDGHYCKRHEDTDEAQIFWAEVVSKRGDG